MRGTLKELRSLDNIILADSKGQTEWGEKNMLLDGVQIDHFEHERDGRPYNLNLEETWLSGRCNRLKPRQLEEKKRRGRVEQILNGDDHTIKEWDKFLFGSANPVTFRSDQPK
ncbi:hypothetical protein BST61_g6027 [Cercospora zeina]